MPPREGRLRAGAATEDVTPDEPVALSGYGAREGRSTGVNDPLSATALVLDDGAVTVALASVDLLNVSRELTHRIRRSLADDGLELDELLLAATHTHAGPYVPARALDVSPVLDRDVDVSGTVAEIERGIAGSIARAHERREPARIRVGHAREEDVQVNRRAAGGVTGNVRVPHGPVDPEVTALLVETGSGERAVVYNFACHPVCTTPDETLVSADWPGYARRRIQSEIGDVRVLFVNGAAGDVNPEGSSEPRTGDEVYEYMEDVGTRVGDAVLRAVADAEASPGPALQRASVRVDAADLDVPVKRTPPVEAIRERIDALEDELERLDPDEEEAGYAATEADLRYARELLAVAEWDARRLPSRLPYVEVGDLGVLGMPGEVHAEHGLRLKARARVSTLVTAGYVNDYIGYVPTLGDLEHGGYEVRTMKIDPDAIVEVREAASGLVGDHGRRWPGAGGDGG